MGLNRFCATPSTHSTLPHTVWIKPSQKCIFPVINPQKQKAELAGLHPNISQWGWSWALSCPWGLWKQKAIADGWMGDPWAAQSTDTSSALPSPIHAGTDSKTSELDPKSLSFHSFCHIHRFCFYNTRIRQARKTLRATSDNPNITLMPSVTKLIPKLAFQPCTDNEHSESWKTESLWSGTNVHRGEKEEMFYKFTQSLIISTVIQQLCPSWTDTRMHTKYKNI